MDQKQLELILKERGIKQSWVADKLKVSESLVSKWVKGSHTIGDKYAAELRALLLN